MGKPKSYYVGGSSVGYDMRQVESQFLIKAERKAGALEALKALARTGRNIRWVDNDRLLSSDSLRAALAEFGWNVYFDALVDIILIRFGAEKSGDEDLLFSTIAPYVQAGSFIEMTGEDGERWRWVFDGKEVHKLTAKIVWEE